jgi:hypothetical protein
MTKAELSKFKKILEAKRDELEQIVRKRDAMHWMKYNMQPSANSPFEILTANPSCFAACVQLFAA